MTKTKFFNTPLFKRPENLISKKINGKIKWGTYNEKQQFAPYKTREEINNIKYNKNDVVLWVNDKVERTFLQIQGSGKVLLQDGSSVFLAYDGQNGHPYTPIGRTLIKLNLVPREKMSMQAIKKWLRENEFTNNELYNKVLNSDKSFVFFRLTNQSATGGSNAILKPKKSIAIDYRKTPYGTPIWVRTYYKHDDKISKLNYLSIAEDTGGAIRGVNRADIYWGYGEKAAEISGKMQNKGLMYYLIPKK